MVDQQGRGPAPGSHGAEGAKAAAPGPSSAFATALREALDRRGLTLQRLHAHLAARGVEISPVTLSHWQRGRSQPERAQSLRAVSEIEAIASLPAGALRDLLGPRRPRGRMLSPPADPETAMRRVYDAGSAVERLLGAEFTHFNEDTVPLTVYESVRLDRHGCVASLSVSQVVCSVKDGAERLTVYHAIDDPQTPSVEMAARCGTILSRRFEPELQSVVAEIGFGRPLARGETAVVDYTFDIGDRRIPSHYHERVFRVSPRQYLLHVYFHREALPRHAYSYYRRRTTEKRLDLRPLLLDSSHTAHLLTTRCSVGVHGMGWE